MPVSRCQLLWANQGSMNITSTVSDIKANCNDPSFASCTFEGSSFDKSAIFSCMGTVMYPPSVTSPDKSAYFCSCSSSASTTSSGSPAPSSSSSILIPDMYNCGDTCYTLTERKSCTFIQAKFSSAGTSSGNVEGSECKQLRCGSGKGGGANSTICTETGASSYNCNGEINAYTLSLPNTIGKGYLCDCSSDTVKLPKGFGDKEVDVCSKEPASTSTRTSSVTTATITTTPSASNTNSAVSKVVSLSNILALAGISLIFIAI